jgi:hypothetical protein
LCFPVQTIMFAAVCIYATYLYRNRCPIDKPAVMDHKDVEETVRFISYEPVRYFLRPFHSQPLAIYGDDICCDSHVTPYVKSVLSRLGFVVGEDKCFTGSEAFRETCGKHYLGGYDVTPLYYRVKGVRGQLSPSHIISQVQLINKCEAAGYKNLRGFLIHVLREWHTPKKLGEFSVPFVLPSSREFGIHSKIPSNTHLVSRDNTELQRTEWRVWAVASERKLPMDSLHEKYSYMRWRATHVDPSMKDLEGPSGHTATVGCRIGWSWTPLY